MMEGFFGFVLELNIYKLIRQHEELYKIEHEIFTCQCQGLWMETFPYFCILLESVNTEIWLVYGLEVSKVNSL